MDRLAWAGYAASWTTEGTSGEKTVTEAEWLACRDPTPMLDEVLFDWEEATDEATSPRKLRLFMRGVEAVP